jgi:Tol biopolymer transport system component
VAFNSNRAGPIDIYRKRASGAGTEEPVLKSPEPLKNLWQWSPDGRTLVFSRPSSATGWDVWITPATPGGTPTPYIQTPFNETFGAISPDGRWMAYVSDESGKPEVYVQSFPTPGDKYQVSTSGASTCTWSRDGKEMIILGLDITVFAVPIRTAPVFEAGTPRALFKARPDAVGFAVTPDPQRFLYTVPLGQVTSNTLTLELNWTAALKKP